jgi:hypothetical protein
MNNHNTDDDIMPLLKVFEQLTDLLETAREKRRNSFIDFEAIISENDFDISGSDIYGDNDTNGD